MSEQLAYSIHLGSDKNRKNKSKKIAEGNPSGSTSFSNNGIQNSTQLSRVNKHNLRDYDNDREMIQIIYGTDNLYKNVKDMKDYKVFKQQYEKYNKRLSTTNTKTEKVDKTSKDVNAILDNLKPTRINKNNRIISNEDIEIIKNYTKDVKDTTKSIKSVNDLNILIEDFEDSYNKLSKENKSLKYEIELEDNEINDLKDELSSKDKIIDRLRTEKEKLKFEVQKFKGFWRSIMKYFQEKIGFDKDKQYRYVSDDLYRNGIFDDNDNEIANNVRRKVKTIDEINQYKIRKKNNDTRF